MVSMVERVRNEADGVKNSHETVNLAQTPFFTPVLAVQDFKLRNSCARQSCRA